MMSQARIREYYNVAIDKEKAFADILKETTYTADKLRSILGLAEPGRKVSPSDKAIKEFHKVLDDFENKSYDEPTETEINERIIKLYNEGYSYRKIADEVNLTTAQTSYRISSMKKNFKGRVAREKRLDSTKLWCGTENALPTDIAALQANVAAYDKMISDCKSLMKVLEANTVTLAVLKEDTLKQIEQLKNQKRGNHF